MPILKEIALVTETKVFWWEGIMIHSFGLRVLFSEQNHSVVVLPSAIWSSLADFSLDLFDINLLLAFIPYLSYKLALSIVTIGYLLCFF